MQLIFDLKKLQSRLNDDMIAKYTLYMENFILVFSMSQLNLHLREANFLINALNLV